MKSAVAAGAVALHRRAIDGVLFADKPVGITSQTAVLRAKQLYGAAKAGHTGTLDPMASGLLPVCFGEATKFSHLLLDADKEYVATIRLGTTTSTGDLEGAVTATAPVDVNQAAVEAVLNGFVGEILQTPPMYSAIKHAGKPLYRYARAGIAVDRAPRCVRIRRLVLDGYSGNEMHISLACSKGTYVRVLAEDIGRALGCGACLSALRRTVIGQFTIDGALPFDALQAMTTNEREAYLKPVDTLVAALPRIDLDAAQTRSIRSGIVVGSVEHAAQGLVRLYGPGERYLGIAMVEPPGRLVPRRLMATSP